MYTVVNFSRWSPYEGGQPDRLYFTYFFLLYNKSYISFQPEVMDLYAKFELTTSSQSISIRYLVVDRKYSVFHAKRIVTKFGPTTLLTLQDSDSAINLQIFLPKRLQ